MTDKLRDQILKKFGNPINSPKDCEILSQEIMSRTKRSISPTTLRRFFDLLPSGTNISSYSLDTLSIFAGAKDYRSFCSKYKNNNKKIEAEQLQIEEEIKKLTEYTLKSISRKSLLPYTKTIPRKDLNYKLDRFIKSNANFFPLISPSGYGKSIALSHWVGNLEDSTHCLYCPASIFYSFIAGKKAGNNRLQFDLNSTDNVLNLLYKNDAENAKKLIFVLDAVDEISSEIEKLYEFTEYLLDAISLYKKSIKFIISVRESVWNAYLQAKLRGLEADMWFEKTETLLAKGYTNMPLLSNSEIKSIFFINNVKDQQLLLYECIPWDIRELLRIPLNMYFIIQLLNNNKKIIQLSNRDLTTEFLKKFIFQSRLAEQKEDIIWKLLEIMENEEDNRAVHKNELKAHYPVHLKREGEYYKAYHELLQNGILIEERESNKYGVYVSKVAFRHQSFFYYLLSLYLIRKNNGLDRGMLYSLGTLEKNELIKNNLIALLYENAYENEDYNVLKDFCSLPEEVLSSLPVKIAVGNSFRRKNRIRDRIIREFAANKKGRIYFFEQFVDTNYMFNNFKFRIQEYLKYENEKEARLFGNCILFLAGFLKLNAVECSNTFVTIRNIHADPAFHPWPTGRKVASRILYGYFIEGESHADILEFVRKHARMAYNYPGYLKKGILDFEMTIIVALVLAQKFDVLKVVLDEAFDAYNLFVDEKNPRSFLKRSQNSVPISFYEYAKFKLGFTPEKNFPSTWETALTNYSPTFDDYLYLILINWFLCDYYMSMGNSSAALNYHSTSLELSRFAEYDFFEAFLLINDPLKSPKNLLKAEKMISKSGFISDSFNFR